MSHIAGGSHDSDDDISYNTRMDRGENETEMSRHRKRVNPLQRNNHDLVHTGTHTLGKSVVVEGAGIRPAFYCCFVNNAVEFITSYAHTYCM